MLEKKPAKLKGIKKSTTKVMTELHDTVSAVASVSSLPSAPTIQRQGDNSSIGSTKTGGAHAVASSDISDSSLVHSPIVINQSVPAGIKISSSSLTQSPVVINQSVPSSVPVVQSSQSFVNSSLKSPMSVVISPPLNPIQCVPKPYTFNFPDCSNWSFECLIDSSLIVEYCGSHFG